MKILHVVESLRKNAGGAAEIVPVIAEEQHLAGAEVSIVTLTSHDYSETAIHARDSGVSVSTYPRSRIMPRILGFSLPYVMELDSLIRKVDVVHVHGMWQFFGWWAASRAKKVGKKLVMQPHGSLEPERLKISKTKKSIIGKLIDRPLLRRADCVLTTAESEREHVVAYGLLPEKVSVAALGMHIEPYVSSKRNPNLLARLGADLSKKHLLYFSRITPIKGLDLLCEAWSKLKELHGTWQLVITGPDDRGYTDVMKATYAMKLPAGCYVFTGPVYGAEKFDLLKSVDAFVLPTKSENFSLAVAEAMASELPVVCTKGAPWEIVQKAGAGFWVDISAEGIANGLKKILSLDDVECKTMGEKGRRCVQDNYSWKVITAEMMRIYVNL